MAKRASLIIFLSVSILTSRQIKAQSNLTRKLSGVIVTQKNEAVEGVSVIAWTGSGEQRTVSDADGHFGLTVSTEPLKLKIEPGRWIQAQHRAKRLLLLRTNSAG
ncbi:MAG: hypothetical protein DMG05_17965 [Acidobacteria bacterium]|nr:MAG: hypothetical protein DMG05_17965 [Acidobacteriota bacterium]